MRDIDIAIIWQKIQRMIDSCTTVRQLHNTRNYYLLFRKLLSKSGDKKTLSSISPMFGRLFSYKHIEIWNIEQPKLINKLQKEL